MNASALIEKQFSGSVCGFNAESEEHLWYLHGAKDDALQSRSQGYIGFVSLDAKKKKNSEQRLVKYKEAALTIATLGNRDISISLNSFTYGRGNDRVQQYRCVAVDLDCHKAGMTPEAALEALESDYFGSVMPWPTIITKSGQGLHLYWILSEIPTPTWIAKQVWRPTTRHYQSLLQALGADPNATDDARVLRLAGTYNTKAQAWVRIVRRYDRCFYTLDELAAIVPTVQIKVSDPIWKEKDKHFQELKKTRGKINGAVQRADRCCRDIEADIRNLRLGQHAGSQAQIERLTAELGVAERGYREAEAVLAAWDAEHPWRKRATKAAAAAEVAAAVSEVAAAAEEPARTPKRFWRDQSGVFHIRNLATLARDRMSDLERLRDIRGARCEGSRELMCWRYFWEALTLYNEQEAMLRVHQFNSGFTKPLSQNEVDGAATNSSRRVYAHLRADRDNYNWTTERYLEMFEITEAEQRQLQTLVGTTVRNERRALRARESRRNERGLTKRQQAKVDKLAAIQGLLSKGLRQAEIADQLGLSAGYVCKLVAAAEKFPETCCPFSGGVLSAHPSDLPMSPWSPTELVPWAPSDPLDAVGVSVGSTRSVPTSVRPLSLPPEAAPVDPPGGTRRRWPPLVACVGG